MRTGHVHRALQQQARAFELRGHVGDLPLQALEIGQGLVAELALVHVVHRVLERALRGADTHRRVAAAFVVDVRDQRLERLAVRGVAPQQHVVGLDPHVVERELGFARRPQTHLDVRARDRDARRLEVDHHGADALRPGTVGETAPHEARAGFVTTCDVVLVGVQPESVTVGTEAGAHVADRASGLGLADSDAEQAFAARRDRQPAVLHRVVAEVLDRARRSVEDELGEDCARHVGARELFEDDRRLDVAESGAAPALTDGDAEQLGLAHSVPRPLRELFGLVAVTRHRRELALGDITCELPQRGLILGIGERIRTGRVRGHAERLLPGLTRTSGRAGALRGIASGVEEHLHGALDHEEHARAEQRGLHDGRWSEEPFALALLGHDPGHRLAFGPP